MPFISKLLLTFAPLLNRERDVDNEISDYLWTIHHADGSYFFASRADEDVPEAVCEGDGPVGCQFHRHRAADIFLHRRCDLYPDEAEYPESLDAAMGVGLYYPRNPVAGKVGSNIASELGTMRVTQQIDALEIMGVNSASYLILPKIMGMLTIMPCLVVFSSATGILGAYATAYIGHVLPPDDLTLGLQHDFKPWFMWMSIIKSQFFAFIISSVPSFCGYTVEGGSVNVGKASTDAVVTSSVLILFSDVFLTQLLS